MQKYIKVYNPALVYIAVNNLLYIVFFEMAEWQNVANFIKKNEGCCNKVNFAAKNVTVQNFNQSTVSTSGLNDINWVKKCYKKKRTANKLVFLNKKTSISI